MTEFLTPSEVVEWFRLPSVAVLYQWHHKGYGPKPVRIGRHLRYSRTECERFIEEQAGRGKVSAR